MRNSRYRYLVPNGVTFLSLACGIVSILLSATGNLKAGGALILASYVLDLFDGELARRLSAQSEFGLQLDSLVDMVSLGTAPAVLAFFHLRLEGGVSMALVWTAVVLFPLAGAFRLARFNLLPAKPGQIDSVGLTISTAGATLSLAVLSDIAVVGNYFPNAAMPLLMLLLAFLMASTIAFPSIAWVFSRRRLSVVLLALFGATIVALGSISNAWFIFTSGYLGASLLRIGYRRMRA